ncbi:hypothetical protein PAXRUDRAFT_28616 [Paxillus rubicundulus Ve08.2h10]|uniref:Uncharacterized protein n=1 Tax=Paxillus rubicundulus Ve08.2h10 TaxID=930991 RepID=A0A0D0CSY5_9AGAM|nr:hypothetical protein PAXRUDRAFT_28616 [Paxillus rubicundulus Ve08.2h10]
MSRSVPTLRGMPYQAQPGAHTTSGTHSFPLPFFPTSSESPYEPMDASEDLLQQPDSPTSLEPPVWPDSHIVSPPPAPSPQYQPQHLSETMPSSGGMVSAPVDYARVIPPTHVGSTIVPSTCSTPIPLIHGAPIPLAQSIPTLVPRRMVQLPPQVRAVCVGKKARDLSEKARVRASGFEREDDEPIENNPPPPSSSTLGLYDDPEGGDEVHNDPLLCTEPVSDGSDSEALPPNGPRASSTPMTIPTLPAYEPPLNPLQVYQDAHTTWFGWLLIIMVAILHTKHLLLTLCMLEPTSPIPMTLNTVINHLDLSDRFVVYLVWAQNKCLQAKSLISYHAENLLISFMTPGPQEPTRSQLQNYLKVIIDDLFKLYEDGVVYHTPSHPQGQRVTKEELFSDESLRNEFEGRNGEEHHKGCFEEKSLQTDEECEEYFQKHGVQWTELAQLPYFNLVWHTIIDPMHNLLLGIVKTQWYNWWIQTSALRASTQSRACELNIIHKFLNVIPVVWDAFIEEAENEHQTSLTSFSKRQAQFMKDWKAWQEWQAVPPSTSKGKGKKGKKGTNDDKEPKPPKSPKVCMQRGEPTNFLHPLAALKIFCGSSIKLDMLPRAKELLQGYLFGFKQMYGAESMKPNFHWAVHLAQQIRDYGPVYNFWAFLSERLNKVLKSSNSNNWTGGQIEISMM